MSASIAILVAICAPLFVVSHGEETLLMRIRVPIESAPRALRTCVLERKSSAKSKPLKYQHNKKEVRKT